MAKDNREILHGITQAYIDTSGKHPKQRTRVFVPGMEDELAAAYTQAQLKQMVQRGDLSGNWKSTKMEPMKVEK
jgi:hypothetical protein